LPPAKPELLILAADCDDTELDIPTGFLKSRVYAKLLTRLIWERYQTFNRQVKEVLAEPHDSEDYKIGKSINSYATKRATSR
jgi:hypothetical protein